MNFKVRKTTLSEANRGQTSMKANCYYKRFLADNGEWDMINKIKEV